MTRFQNIKATIIRPMPYRIFPITVILHTISHPTKKCQCDSGYEFKNNQCEEIMEDDSDPYYYPIQNTPLYIPPIPAVTPIISPPAEKEPFKVDEGKIKLFDASINAILETAGAFRNCPSKLCTVIRYYAEGAKLKIVGGYNNNEWFKIEGKNDQGRIINGWMHSSLFADDVLQQDKITIFGYIYA